MDIEKLVHAVIDPIVEDPDSVLIRAVEEDNGKDVLVIIATEKNDTAKLIGRHGNVANSIREVLSLYGKTENKRIHVKFESFDEDKEG